MDTSEQYIKMCGKAVEIQNHRILANGDFEVRFKHGRGQVEVHHHREVTAHYKPENHLWLPRQDQLQEMICKYINGDWLTALYRFNRFSGGEELINGTLHNVFSMEQLWLAYVMEELYSKAWNGEDWD